MHIGQFSLVICSFVLAVTSYFIWPYARSRLVPILILAGAVPLFVFARIFKRPTFRLHLTSAALVLLLASLGFAWAQMRSHMQARNGTAPVEQLQINGVVAWYKARASGSQWNICVQEGNNRL